MTYRSTYITRGAALAVLLLSACHISPEAAGIIKAVDLAACAVLEARLPAEAGQIVGDVCSADKPLLDAVLSAITVTPTEVRARAPLAQVAQPRPPVHCGARAIGHLDADLAPLAQTKLDARPECGKEAGAR